ncbi:hypothetical protein Gogos_020889 [Gossypium gossypioides]|uniref:UBC core domain-containing protein n=1 Tax=Gossypium gossypioides TaxID=34282 RepID=A0A7J9D192_GOSGO|nr:hypothetical protein [Gossypium gossypioides]
MDMLLTDSDWETFSESGSSEEQEDTEFLYGGRACTILSSLEESIGKIDDLLSFERGFFHGDIVRSVTDPCGQMGRVVDIDMFVDLETVNGKVIKDINSNQLLKIRSISVGDYVVNSTWIGKVDKVVDRVTIVLDDGSKCEVTAMGQDKLVPVSPNLIDDLQYPYYPGQRVRVVPSDYSSSTGWLCGTWRENRDEGTVSSVEAGFVYVDWISSAHLDHDMSASPPSHLQEAKDLTLLVSFPHANWQLGDWCMLSFADGKGTSRKFLHASTRDLINDNWKLEKGFKIGNLGSRLEELFVIIKTRTKVNVMWQDGTCGMGLDSHTLLPVSVTNAHEFWPHQFVFEKGTNGDTQRWGVVRGVDAKERTVKVLWRNKAVIQANDFDREQMEETVSAYELVEHPNYCYCFGDIVVKAIRNHFGDQAEKGTEAASEGKNMKRDENNRPCAYCPSCIGVVIGFEDGNLEVKWASGIPTKVAPYEISRIDKCEGSATTPGLYEENTEDFNEEMFVHETQSNSHKGKELLSFDSAHGSGEKFSWAPASFFRPQAAIELFSSIASSFLGSLASVTLLSQEKEVSETCNDSAELDPSEMQIFETTNIKQEVEEIEENNMMPRLDETSGRYRQFDMVSDCSDHHFLGESKVLAVSQVKRSWVKKVQQEWSILEKNLPEIIYVRVYEERMDLLRAVLVGAPGTPYHDGLFFFDIFLPSNYPYEPPHFEALVKEHFSKHAETIISACNAYMEGAPVGYALECGKKDHDENFKGSSTGFKIMLSKLLPKLVEAFSDQGIDCSQFRGLNK